MSLTFAIESVATAWPEVYDLAVQHWAGTSTYRRHEPFNPSRERYEQYNQSGFFRLLTARKENRLVGYFGLYLTQSMHSQLTMVTEDTFFLHPDHRGGRNALRFLQFIEQLCRQWQVHEIMFSCEIDNESGIKELLAHLDYRPVIMAYSKRLSSHPHADSVTCSLENVHAVKHTQTLIR